MRAVQARDVYESLRTEINALYPASAGWVEMVNPYDPSMTDDLNANQAWGLSQGPGTNTNRLVNCAVSWNRNFEFILVRKYHSGLIRTDNAMSTRRQIETQLFLDQEFISKKFESDSQTDDDAVIANMRVVSDNGIEFMRDGDEQFFMIKSTIFTEYFVPFK